MSNNEQRYDRPKNVFDLDKFRLYGNQLPDGTSQPTLIFNLINGNPRFKVFTNSPSDKNDGLIAFHMDPITFNVFLLEMKDLIDGKTKSVRISYNDYTFFNRQRSENIVEISMIIVEKDEGTGMYFIALVAKDRPKIRFFFRSPIYHKIHKEDGTQIDEVDDSFKYMRAYYETLKTLIAPAMVRHSNEGIEAQERRKQAYREKMEQRNNQQASNAGQSPSKHGGFDY